VKVTEVTTHVINSTWRDLGFVRVHADFATSNFVIQEWFPYELPEHYGLVDHPFEPTHKDG
jgi:hypothetical protein